MVLENRSASSLIFGSSKELAGTVEFEIYPSYQRRKKMLLIDKNTAPNIKDIIIPAGTRKEMIFKLSNFYDMTEPGTYAIKAKVSHPMLSAKYASNESAFNVTRGNVVWESVAGVPNLAASVESPQFIDKTPESIKTRTYRILSSNIGKANVYTLKVEDERKIYLLKRIGFDLGANLAPKCQVDFLSRLHLIIAASPHAFAYYVFDIDGRMVSRNVLMKTETTPSLYKDPKTGVVAPVGGREAIKDVDYSEISKLPFLSDY